MKGEYYIKKLLAVLFIALLIVGYSTKGEVAEEEIQPVEVEEPVEVVEVHESDEVIDDDIEVIGEVFAKYKESFDEDISEDWLISKYITLEPSPQGVYFEEGTVRLELTPIS